jgi:3-phosphoshikimate 1-carboxyvinyltransferase
LPARIYGRSGRGNEARIEGRSEKGEGRAAGSRCGSSCIVSIEESSQFASALLLCAKAGGWQVEVTGDDAEESPYVAMTTRLIEAFPHQGGRFQVEPDASSGSYFKAANWLVSVGLWMADFLDGTPYWSIESRFHELWQWIHHSHALGASGPPDGDLLAITVRNWPPSGWQIDADFPCFLPLPEQISREGQLGDSIMMAIVLAADVWGGLGLERREKGIRFTDLGRLRVQECERVVALRTELTKCGAKVIEEGDTVTVVQSTLHGAEIETYNDHRMAMCFAILGLKVPGIKIKNPGCVKKTFPNFFQKLAAAPPKGLGATIRDAITGRTLESDELFAE